MLRLKVVVGVSGGPDSMLLLTQLIESTKYKPVVVHVNYGFRKESKDDQKLVENYCKENGVKFYSTKVNKKIWDKYSYLHNKQSIARQIRYDLFYEACEKEDVNVIFTGHHKDDFIETAIMQEERSGDYLFYGISKDSYINGYNVHRPLMDMWKSEILEEVKQRSIPYNVDKTNLEPLYRRNQVRSDLNDLSIPEKDKIFEKYQKINDKNSELIHEVDSTYKKLFDSGLDWNVFNEIKDSIKPFVVYKMLINNKTRINISSDKIKAIIDFLKNKRGDKGYRLMENLFLTVKKSKIIIYNNNKNNYGNRK